MKNIGLFLLFLVCARQAAADENNVQLYGMVNSGMTYISNGAGGSSVRPTAAVRRAATAGAAGRESLGDGLSSLFVLESGFNLQNGKSGQGGLMFGRQAYVGLANQRYGTLTLGRQYDSLSDTVGMFPSSNNFATGYGSHFGDLNNLNQSIRINDAVKYVSPEFGGPHAWHVQLRRAVRQLRGQSLLGAGNGLYERTALHGDRLPDIHPPATRANGTGGVYESNGNYVGSLGQYVGLQDADAMKVIGAERPTRWGRRPSDSPMPTPCCATAAISW